MNATLTPTKKVTNLFLSNLILDSLTKIDPGYSLNKDIFLKLKALCIKIKVISIVTIYKSHLLNNLNNSRSLTMHLKKCINLQQKVHNNQKIKDNRNFTKTKG